jgi:3-oxoadipate enol-lactonase
MQAQVRDLTINYDLQGPEQAPVITCCHCLSGDLNIWKPQLQALRETYRVLRLDLRGHGRSSAPVGDYTMDMLSEDVLGLLDVLGIQQTHFLGISLGGMIGQTLAIKHQERLSSLIACDTTCRVPPDMEPVWRERIETAKEKGMDALAEETLSRWLSPAFRVQDEATTSQIKQTILSTPVDGFIGCCKAISTFDLKDRLPQISLPCLVMVGEHDPGTPLSNAEEIQAQIPGAELVVVPQSYHLSNVEGAADFNSRVLDFLGRLSA